MTFNWVRLVIKMAGTVIPTLVVLLFSSTSLSAQTAGTGALTGTVTDSTGGRIANTTVTLTNNGTAQSRSVMTGTDGVYKFNLLPPGNYRVRFEASGFSPVDVPSIDVNVTETPVLDRTLGVGSQAQQVTVEAEAETIQTENASSGTTLTRDTVVELPLSTRNFVTLLANSAGTGGDANNATALGKGWESISVNGTSSALNNFQIDGASVNNWASGGGGQDSYFFAGLPVPNPDAIQEFKILTSNFDASYGRNSGANVNVVTRGGTNQFHGSAFEFFRNTLLDANDWFFKRSEASFGQPNKPGVFNQNQFGGSIGGPIKKDKVFFFGTYQETEQKNGVTAHGFTSVGTPPIPSGNRGSCPSGWTVSTQCDSNAQTFIQQLGADNCGASTLHGGTQVACNGSNINPVAINLLQLKLADGTYYIPSPSPVAFPAAGHFQVDSESDPAIYHEHQAMANFDYVINSKHTLSTRYFYSADPTDAPFNCQAVGGNCLLGAPIHFDYPNHSANIRLTSLPTSNLVNEARVSFQRYGSHAQNLEPFTNSQVGITPMVSNDDLLSALTVTGAFVAGGQQWYGVDIFDDQYQYADQISWSHGRQTLRAGAEFDHYNFTIRAPGLSLGSFTFSTFDDFLIGRCATNSAGCTNPNGSAFSNISSVQYGYIRADNGQIEQTYLDNGFSWFVQDDVNVTSRLTLNLGVRWEYNAFPTVTDGLWSLPWRTLIATQPIPGNSPATGSAVGYVVPSNYPGTVPPGVYRNSNATLESNRPPLDNFAPRGGFAWQPFGGGRFVVRGGGGVFFDVVDGIYQTGDGFGEAPAGFTIGTSPSATLAQPYVIPATAPGPAGTPGFPLRWANFSPSSPNYAQSSNLAINNQEADQNLLTPTTYRWSLDAQYSFLPTWLLDVGYVGMHSFHQIATLEPVNVAQLATASNPLYCGADGVGTDCVTSSTPANIALRVPYLGFASGIAPHSQTSESKYNSLQVTVRKSLSHGVQLNAAYTWARSFVGTWIGNPEATQPGIPPVIEVYAPDTTIRPQRLSINYSWAIPSGHFNGVLNKVTSGWTWSGTTLIQDGYPLQITDSRAGTVFTNSGGPTTLATLCPGASISASATSGSLSDRVTSGLTGGPGYLNKTGVFCSPQTVLGGTGFGGDGLSGVAGPNQEDWDMALAKTTRVGGLSETATVEFRAEFFNTFNHPNFSNPATNVALGSFGQITSLVVNPRIIQFGLKYLF